MNDEECKILAENFPQQFVLLCKIQYLIYWQVTHEKSTNCEKSTGKFNTKKLKDNGCRIRRNFEKAGTK